MSTCDAATPSAKVICASTSSPQERRWSVRGVTRRLVESARTSIGPVPRTSTPPARPTIVAARTPTERCGATASKAKRTRSSGEAVAGRCPRSRGSRGRRPPIRRGGARRTSIVAGSWPAGSSSVAYSQSGQSLARWHDSTARSLRLAGPPPPRAGGRGLHGVPAGPGAGTPRGSPRDRTGPRPRAPRRLGPRRRLVRGPALGPGVGRGDDVVVGHAVGEPEVVVGRAPSRPRRTRRVRPRSWSGRRGSP